MADSLSSGIKAHLNQITPRDALSGTTNELRSPNGGAKRSMPVTMEDLDQDFAFEIFENFQLGKELKDDVATLKSEVGQTRDMILTFIKEEILKFRSEVRTTLSEHYEYIKELHATLEKDIKNTSSEYRSMIS